MKHLLLTVTQIMDEYNRPKDQVTRVGKYANRKQVSNFPKSKTHKFQNLSDINKGENKE